MKTHITTLNNMAGTASLAHRRVLKVAQSIGCHEMGLSFYPLKPDYAKEIDKRLDGIIAPLNYGDIVIFQYPSWIGVNYDESFVNKIKSYRDTKLIIFVQDIQKLMFDSEQAILDMEIKTLNKADLLILPSKKMHRYLKENGLDEKPVIYQTIWDMPSDICFVDHAVTRCFHFAGNYNRSLIILTAYRVIKSMAGAVAERKIAIKIPIHSNTHPCLTDTFLTTSPTSWTPV